MNRNEQRVALTVAGSDCGGNAGIQADVRAFHVFGLHACTVITAMTAQNPTGVRAVQIAEPSFVKAQLDAVFEAYSVGAAKAGMLATKGIIECVADYLEHQTRRLQWVIDPVMVATSGAKLLEDAAIEALCTKLLPLATLVTPNLPEAGVILDHVITTEDEMAAAARAIFQRYGCATLIKGGHHAEHVARDVLFDGHTETWFSTPTIERPLSTHGTGCSLSAGITAALAMGHDVREAVRIGKAYVYESIRQGVWVGPEAAVLGTPPQVDPSCVTC